MNDHGRVERPPGRVVPTMEQRNVETISSNDPGLMDEAVNTMEDPDLPPGYSTPPCAVIRTSGLGSPDVTDGPTLEVGQAREGEESQGQVRQGSEEEEGGGERKKKKNNKKKKPVLAKVDTEPIGGGPTNETLLKNFRNHRAYAIWNNKDHQIKNVKLMHHHKNLTKWKYAEESARFKAKWMACGLTHFARSCFTSIDNLLINTLIERWQPETNTFHLPFGEMTITLDDVATILGIPVTGKPLFSTSSHDSTQLLMDILGVTETEATKALSCSYVKTTWLRTRFSGTLDQDDKNTGKKASTDVEVDCAVRAYILYVLGCSVFVDKTGTSVHVQYLHYLKDLAEIPKYNWGGAVLAYLYRQLSLACIAKTMNMGGCFTLLQVWIHEHLKFRSPVADPAYNEAQPRAYKWMPRVLNKDKETCEETYVKKAMSKLREELDDISRVHVVWDPYRSHRDQHPFQEIAWFKGSLLCCEVCELYNPDRVKRQFGRKQNIPFNPMPSTANSSKLAKKLSSWEDNCISIEKRGDIVSSGWDSALRYHAWYSRVSHIKVQNPDFRTNLGCNATSTRVSYGISLRELVQKGVHICDEMQAPHVKEIFEKVSDGIEEMIAENAQLKRQIADKERATSVPKRRMSCEESSEEDEESEDESEAEEASVVKLKTRGGNVRNPTIKKRRKG